MLWVQFEFCFWGSYCKILGTQGSKFQIYIFFNSAQMGHFMKFLVCCIWCKK
jgi:hypothetical protein